MSEDDYRPKSPDLDFGSYSPPHQDQPQQPQQQPPQQRQQPAPLRVNPPQNWYQSPQGQDDYNHSRSYSYSATATAQSPPGSAFYSYQPLSATTPLANYNSPRFPPQPYQTQQHGHPQQAYTGQEQQPYFPPAVAPHASGYQQPAYQSSYPQQDYTQPGPYQPYIKPENPYNQQAQFKAEDSVATTVKAEDPEDSKMPPRRAAAAAAAADTPAVEPSPVKTKFPTARIKRIMQADEEVGKVAQQTPIAVGKALEMFMIQLVSKSAEVARDKNSKRVTPAMLKTVVEADDQWDFLRDIVSKVEQDKEGGGSKGKATAKAESDSEEDSDVPKKKRGGGKRKRAA